VTSSVGVSKECQLSPVTGDVIMTGNDDISSVTAADNVTERSSHVISITDSDNAVDLASPLTVSHVFVVSLHRCNSNSSSSSTTVSLALYHAIVTIPGCWAASTTGRSLAVTTVCTIRKGIVSQNGF